MAIKGTVTTNLGESRELYIRFNNFDQLTNNNNDVPALVRFRGFISQDAFKDGRNYAWEHVVSITDPIDWKNVQEQVYKALKAEKEVAEDGSVKGDLVTNVSDV